jgi:tetratricopeptide (TPR) repeat protein
MEILKQTENCFMPLAAPHPDYRTAPRPDSGIVPCSDYGTPPRLIEGSGGVTRSRFNRASIRWIISGLAVIAVQLIITQNLPAQDFKTVKDAFQNSYIQEATGEVSAAVNSLKAVYDEKSYELNLRLGWLSYQAGNFTESLAYYGKAVDLMPYAVEPRFGIVYPGAAMGNWSMVIAQYNKILEITPNNSIAMHRLGLIYYGKKEYDTAKQYFEKVVNLFPFDYDALTMLAWSHFQLKNYREAKVLFQKALLNTPGGSSALEGLDLLK